jgi:hypothetical protein
MAIYEWIGIALCLAVYGVPFGVGLFVSSWTKAILLAFASFAGLFLSIWSTLGPLPATRGATGHALRVVCPADVKFRGGRLAGNGGGELGVRREKTFAMGRASVSRAA